MAVSAPPVQVVCIVKMTGSEISTRTIDITVGTGPQAGQGTRMSTPVASGISMSCSLMDACSVEMTVLYRVENRPHGRSTGSSRAN